MMILITIRSFWKQVRTVTGFFQRTQKITLSCRQVIRTTFLFVWAVYFTQAPAVADMPGARAGDFFGKKIRLTDVDGDMVKDVIARDSQVVPARAYAVASLIIAISFSAAASANAMSLIWQESSMSSASP